MSGLSSKQATPLPAAGSRIGGTHRRPPAVARLLGEAAKRQACGGRSSLGERLAPSRAGEPGRGGRGEREGHGRTTAEPGTELGAGSASCEAHAPLSRPDLSSDVSDFLDPPACPGGPTGSREAKRTASRLTSATHVSAALEWRTWAVSGIDSVLVRKFTRKLDTTTSVPRARGGAALSPMRNRPA